MFLKKISNELNSYDLQIPHIHFHPKKSPHSHFKILIEILMDKTLQITFYESETNWIKILEFSRWEIVWFFIPKILYSNGLLDSDYFKDIITNTWVYFLMWEEIYIGQAINIFERLKNHIREWKKEFKDIICFTTSNNSFDEGDINYLEKAIISKAKQNSDVNLMNLNIGNNTNIRNFRKSDLDQYVDEINFILNILWANFLEKTRENIISNEEVFFINSKETKSQLIINKKWYIVTEWSFSNDNETGSLRPNYKKLRENLVENWVIERTEWKLIFKKDHIFSSSTAPAQVLLWYSVSGPQKWKNKDWISLWEHEKNKITD